MDRKEFLDKVLACKTAEELRALLETRVQLSDDETEQISGGRAVGIRPNAGADEANLSSTWVTIADRLGYAAAAEAFCAYTGLGRGAISQCMAGSAQENMEGLISKFLKMRNALENNGKTFR